MKALELHAHLTAYIAQSPDNGQAEVMIQQMDNGYCYTIIGANDAKGMGLGEHLLILVPGGNPLGVKGFAA